MLRVHHPGHSQSERILWLCEELGIPYELTLHERDPVTILSPPELQALHPMGAAPVIQDDGLGLAESAAIVDYIILRHGNGRLRLGPTIRISRPTSPGSISPTAPSSRASADR